MSRGLALNNHPLRMRGGGLMAAFGLLALLLFVTGCETLGSRLARNQALLKTLPPEHQRLIQQGRIQAGFTPAEVYLAWGAPSHKAFTENSQGKLETWYYTAIQTETLYREEHYYDWEFGFWRSYDRPFYRYREYLFQEAVFTNGVLSSFTVYPSYQPYFSGPSPYRSRN